MFQFSGEIRRAFLIWCAANILGLTIPPLVIYLIPMFTAITGLLSSVLIISLPLAIAQWIALRRILPVSALWILSLPASILLFVLIIREIPDRFWPDSESMIVLVLLSTIIGMIIGLPQWLILHREYTGSSIWLLGTILGIGLGTSIVIGTDLVNASGLFAYIVAVLSYSILTGLSLAALISHNDQSESTNLSAA